MTTLVLWDIDNTLVHVGDVPHDIYAAAYHTTTGRLARVWFADFGGRTERGIAVEYLAANGMPATDDMVARFLDAVIDATEARCGDLIAAGGRLPGAIEALKAFAEHAAVQTVVTGNTPATARIKLDVFGLADLVDLDLGGYGHLEVDRAHLVRRAVRLVAERHGPVPAERTVVFGDTARDVRGAVDSGVRAVGVATGDVDATVLAAAGADVVLSDLSDLDAVLAAAGV